MVLLTHDHHADNLDDAGRALLPSAGTVVTTAPGAKRLGGGATGSRRGRRRGSTAPVEPTIEVTATPCRHGPPLSHPIIGDVIGFALSWDGSTGCCGSRATPCSTTASAPSPNGSRSDAALHLGGVRFGITGPVRYTMTAHEAIELCRLLRPRTAIPVHYEGWSHFTEGRDAIERGWTPRPRTSGRASARCRSASRWTWPPSTSESAAGGERSGGAE